ncbi:Maleylacetoacetate isomerase / Glutathione S-transferase [Caballeronia sordidicola]|uniref:Maleylacetoacetate isomerase / Glutathione S-transferase n=1 Tax=Caballeronia sordidicola TaxID=196367 RepID=A0A242M7Q5_CABSO|nr:Maleylacetoacetate isomerase / Glutathione S-transferase [Caballeronia sordidicola]
MSISPSADRRRIKQASLRLLLLLLLFTPR